jgi:hypothetical protein
MNEQLQIEAMARADGFEYKPNNHLGLIVWFKKGHQQGWKANELPDYLHDANPIERMVQVLGDVELSRYEDNLHEIMKRDDPEYVRYSFSIWRSTTAQKVEAYLKAKGLWTKEME